MKITAPALALLLLACHPPGNATDDDALYNQGAQARPLSPGVQPVRIGEGGPAFAACAARGTVLGLSPSGEADLPLRAAPFDEAGEVARLANGATLLLCTRSLDQRWRGVVVPPANAPDTDCGVSAPVDAPRGYAGPCQSGWVLGAFVRARAD